MIWGRNYYKNVNRNKFNTKSKKTTKCCTTAGKWCFIWGLALSIHWKFWIFFILIEELISVCQIQFGSDLVICVSFNIFLFESVQGLHSTTYTFFDSFSHSKLFKNTQVINKMLSYAKKTTAFQIFKFNIWFHLLRW